MPRRDGARILRGQLDGQAVLATGAACQHVSLAGEALKCQPGRMEEVPRALSEIDAEDVQQAAPTSLVVGHDRSADADAALELALQLASELNAPVVILRAWSLTTAPRPANWTFSYVLSEDEFAGAVQHELHADTKLLTSRYPAVVRTLRVHHAGPARALIEASRGARMLVVGSRGLGGFGELVLGSVSDRCVRYAACPVLVVRRRKPL